MYRGKGATDLRDWMDSLVEMVRRLVPRQFIVIRDYNAKYPTWGSPTAAVKGKVVFEWATTAGLMLVEDPS